MLVFVVLVANQLPNFRPHCAGALRISSHVAHDLPESARVPLALNSCPKLLSKMECGNAFVTPALETLYLAGFVLEIEEKEFHGADLRKDSIILPSPKLYRGCSAKYTSRKEFVMLQYRTAFLIGLVLIALAGIGLILRGNQQPAVVASQNTNAPKLTVKYVYQNQTQTLELTKVSVDALEGARFVTGEKNAPFTVVEFADYECPACGVFATEFEGSFTAKFITSGKVRYAYRDFPLSQHANANVAALAASCASDQGKFSEFKAILFRAQQAWSISNSVQVMTQFKDYASQVGLDPSKLETCVQAGTAQKSIDQDVAMGNRVGLTATPSFVISGYLVSGALPPEAFQAVFDQLREKP